MPFAFGSKVVSSPQVLVTRAILLRTTPPTVVANAPAKITLPSCCTAIPKTGFVATATAASKLESTDQSTLKRAIAIRVKPQTVVKDHQIKAFPSGCILTTEIQLTTPLK